MLCRYYCITITAMRMNPLSPVHSRITSSSADTVQPHIHPLYRNHGDGQGPFWSGHKAGDHKLHISGSGRVRKEELYPGGTRPGAIDMSYVTGTFENEAVEIWSLIGVAGGEDWLYCSVSLRCFLCGRREEREQRRAQWWQTRGWLNAVVCTKQHDQRDFTTQLDFWPPDPPSSPPVHHPAPHVRPTGLPASQPTAPESAAAATAATATTAGPSAVRNPHPATKRPGLHAFQRSTLPADRMEEI